VISAREVLEVQRARCHFPVLKPTQVHTTMAVQACTRVAATRIATYAGAHTFRSLPRHSFAAPSRKLAGAPIVQRIAPSQSRSRSTLSGGVVMAAATTLYDFQAKVRPLETSLELRHVRQSLKGLYTSMAACEILVR